MSNGLSSKSRVLVLEWELALNSTVETDQGRTLHIPMIDFLPGINRLWRPALDASHLWARQLLAASSSSIVAEASMPTAPKPLDLRNGASLWAHYCC